MTRAVRELHDSVSLVKGGPAPPAPRVDPARSARISLRGGGLADSVCLRVRFSRWVSPEYGAVRCRAAHLRRPWRMGWQLGVVAGAVSVDAVALALHRV